MSELYPDSWQAILQRGHLQVEGIKAELYRLLDGHHGRLDAAVESAILALKARVEALEAGFTLLEQRSTSSEANQP